MVTIAEALKLLEIEEATDGAALPSAATVKKAFKKMALLYHPDKNKSVDAEEKFKKILKAYETLINVGDRTNYTGDSFFSKFSKFFGETNFAYYTEKPFYEESFEDLLKRIFDDEEDEEEEDPDYDMSEFQEEGAVAHSREGRWSEEEAKSDEERRQFYFCGTDYISVKSVEDWPTYVTTHNIHILNSSEERVTCDEDIAKKVGVTHGSVAHFEADAILSSVNEMLMRGGGVDGYVRRGAGDKIEWELKQYGVLSSGKCVITRGYDLPAKYVIHACGPCGSRPKQLALCYKNALDMAARHNIRTIGMCGISAGNNGYPLNESTRVALKTVRKWLELGDNRTKIDRVVFVCYRQYEVKEYEKWMQKYFPTSQLRLDEAKKELEH